MADHITRPATPQIMVHRLPDQPDASLEANKKPSKFIVIIAASTAVSGKLQVAKTVSSALECPLYQGDSMHETAAKAATVGAASGANETRYQRMWLSKMTRTGLMFAEESRPAGAGFSGFGGSSSTSTSRRGSASSDASDFSASDDASIGSSVMSSAATPKYINKPPIAGLSQEKSNSALLVLTHPKLEAWQEACIMRCVGEYSIGVIFVPLDEWLEEDEEDLPILRPFDPTTMTSFGSFAKPPRNWTKKIVVKADASAVVEDLAEEIIGKVRDVIDE
ncbi:hypothetical protein PRZ48_014407 [Zasmidium cellare]|uniref:Uncharacterized protein n=1 Tax=Zasmidium cellare TaxID=395010 RepID=A0ABR0DY70_ZASCE|nr:hypothetical protein PRZ48_014407 [Zasmidium cellare]